mgnify:CR=1 FL=1
MEKPIDEKAREALRQASLCQGAEGIELASADLREIAAEVLRRKEHLRDALEERAKLGRDVVVLPSDWYDHTPDRGPQ